jgi:hypothetical protein
MQRPGAWLDPSALANVAEGLPFTEGASAECMAPTVVRHAASVTAITNGGFSHEKELQSCETLICSQDY